MNVCLWWTKKKKQQKTSRFMASSKLLMSRRAVLQQLKWLINLIALQRWPAQRCQEPGTRSYRRLVNMPRGKPRRVGCLIFKTARLMRDGYVAETTFSPLWMSPVVGGLLDLCLANHVLISWWCQMKIKVPPTWNILPDWRARLLGKKYPVTTSHC